MSFLNYAGTNQQHHDPQNLFTEPSQPYSSASSILHDTNNMPDNELFDFQDVDPATVSDIMKSIMDPSARASPEPPEEAGQVVETFLVRSKLSADILPLSNCL